MLTDGWPVTAALDPVTGNPDVQYTSDEHAAILAGLIVRDVNGAPRAGVLPRHTDSLVTARPDMKVDVAPFEAVLVNAGIRMIALTEQITLDVAAAQVANTRYDIVYVEVTDRALTGVKSTSAVKIATGQASAIPQDPAVPAGAVRLARLTVPANATATNSGVTITAIHQYTGATNGLIPFRTIAEMNAWAAPDTQLARVIGGSEYARVAGVWRSRDRVAGVRFDGNTNANGILVVNNPLLGMTPTWVQVTMGRIVASDLLSQLLSPIVWDTPVGDTTIQIRFRRHDTNAWAANQPVSGYLTAGG